MSVLTLISRLSDGLILSEEMDADGSGLEEFRNQAKRLFKTFTTKSQDRLTIETGSYYFAYPRRLANIICCKFHTQCSYFDISLHAEISPEKMFIIFWVR